MAVAPTGVDDAVLRAVSESGRAVRFAEIAARLSDSGITRSQVHNAVYRLGKRGDLRRAGSGAAMTYDVVDR